MLSRKNFEISVEILDGIFRTLITIIREDDFVTAFFEKPLLICSIILYDYHRIGSQ